MKRVGSVRGFLAAAIAALMLASSFDTTWTARASSFHANVDPSLSAGEVALVHTTAGRAGALSLKLAGLGAVDIETFSAADTVIARLSNQALAWVATDPSVMVATRDIAVVAMGGGKGKSGFEDKDKDKDKNEDEDEDKDDNDTKDKDKNDKDKDKNDKDKDKDKNDKDKDRDKNGNDGKDKRSIGLLAIRGPRARTTTTGGGVTVAIMDTGIAQHPDLPKGKVRARVDFVRDGNGKEDPGGHGTFIAGIIAANGDLKGVAPDADLVSLRVLDANGNGTLRGVIGAFNWLLRHHAQYDIKVLNLSWGAPQATTYHKDILSALVESAWFSGVTVVASAGNDGPDPGSVITPASDPFIVTVGSFDDHGTVAGGDDTLSTFTGRGPTLDGFSKPDTLAPGEYILSLRVRGVAYLNDAGHPIGSPTDLYIHMTGTSAAAGFASGVAALLAAKHPRYSPTLIKGAIVASGRAITGSDATVIDAPNALTRTPAKVNVGLKPSQLLLAILTKARQLKVNGVTWEGVTWEGVTWETVTWEGVTWEGVTWEGVTWEVVTWETVTAK